MYGDPSHANAGEPLPPVRTRWGSGEPKSGRGGNPLEPVRSGLFGPLPEPPADDGAMNVIEVDDDDTAFAGVESDDPGMTDTIEADVEILESVEDLVADEVDAHVEVVGEDLTEELEPDRPQPFRTIEPPPAEPWAMEPDALWDTTVRGQGDDDELLVDVSLEDVVDEATFDVTRDIDEGDVTPTEPIEASPDAFTAFLDAAEAVRAHPAPLSPWQVGRGAADPDDDPRSARRGHEWEAFGKALADSLGDAAAAAAAAAFDAGGEEVSDESGFDDEFEVAADASAVEGLEPIGAGLDRDSPIEVTAAGSPALLDELAERLERFAAGIRTEGHYAISRAQLSGDRMDAMLAGFAAGWLAAHEQ